MDTINATTKSPHDVNDVEYVGSIKGNVLRNEGLDSSLGKHTILSVVEYRVNRFMS